MHKAIGFPPTLAHEYALSGESRRPELSCPLSGRDKFHQPPLWMASSGTRPCLWVAVADAREFQVAVIRIQPAWLKEHTQSTTVVPAPQFGCGRGETAVSDQEDATRLACLPAVAALVEDAAAEYATLLDDAGLDTAPPADALARFLDAGWRFVDRYSLLLTAPAARIPRPENDPHDFVPPRLERLIQRGRHTGDFAPSLPAA
ncbi:hypothetical protein EDD90_9413 [Streptomyces sp. Ag109_O5-1]|uniref:hypothetical protein n=1 Tax=Streptomyces sp. Ag109_O5-1 TaxID=1938851 RepID=UPI000F966CAA|nr:hypothetical protein [Streptomyces sp. Ag109_O5-1]RPE46091.1 hypothetical protein EDD90_9413 [Streptomyces sp. Ag109_O5-1]